MKAILLAVAAGVCWGVGEVFTKSALNGGRIGPVTAIALRSTVALPVLWLAYLVTAHLWAVEPRSWASAGSPTLLKIALGSGLMAGAAGMVFFYSSLHLGEISRIKPVAFTIAPATAVVIGMLALGEPVTARKLVAIGMILTGVVLLTGR